MRVEIKCIQDGKIVSLRDGIAYQTGDIIELPEGIYRVEKRKFKTDNSPSTLLETSNGSVIETDSIVCTLYCTKGKLKKE